MSTSAVTPLPSTGNGNGSTSTSTSASQIIADIDRETLTYAPAVAVAVQSAEANGGTGLQKFVYALGSVSQAYEGAPNANVAGIATLVNLGVLFANLFGAFSHASVAAAAPPVSTT